MLSKEVLSFGTFGGLSFLMNFEEGGVSITERPTKRLSVGHRREKLFGWYFLVRSLNVPSSGCRERLP